jgi:hypothetical protein
MASIPTWNGYAEPEVGETTLAAATVAGTLLTFSPGNNNKTANTKLGLCTHVNDPVDAILISEVVDAATYKDQYNIYKDIDYSAFTVIGETSQVLKGFKGLTMHSLPLGTNSIQGVNSISVTAGGTGYTNGSPVTLTGGTGSGFTGIANCIGGVIQSITVTNPGVYTVVPTTVVVAGGGSGATFAAPVLSPAPAAKGTELIIDASTSKLKVRPTGDVTSPTIAVCIDALLAGATQTGAVHMV